ncbi:ATP-binding cassette domain-containing protein [Humidesulfovibrio idahonensis]
MANAAVPAVSVRGFVKRYGAVAAVSGLDLSVAQGEIFGLIGPDGAGKSSLLKAVAGVLSYEGGEVRVFGLPVLTEAGAEAAKAHLGFMPQGLGKNLYGDLSIEENIDFFAKLRLVPAQALRERKERLLAMTRLDRFRARPMKQLSGGMKQKLGLVCTLIHAPRLILLDEPTTGVDPVSRRDFWTILHELLAEGGVTALISTAYMDEASRFGRVALLHQGRALAQGPAREVAAQTPGVALRVTTADPARTAEALELLGARYASVRGLGRELRVFLPGADVEASRRALAALLDGAGIAHAVAGQEPPDLEDVFVTKVDPRDGAQDASGPGQRPDLAALDWGAPSNCAANNAANCAENCAENCAANCAEGSALETRAGGQASANRQRAAAGQATTAGQTATAERDEPGGVASGGRAARELAIRAQGLVRDFGSFRAVDNVSFSVKPGEIFGLLGANGAGKTTVIKMLTGILPPTGGAGSVAGADMLRGGREIKERIGYMSQAFSLYTDLTVTENLRLYAGIYGLDRAQTAERVAWAIGLAGLAGRENALTASLPMGLSQRLALCCALLHRPRILFLDEPTSGVDPLGRRLFWDILRQLSRRAGVAVLITTHYMSEAEYCDHLALMYAGRVVADATPADMKAALLAEAGPMLEVDVDDPHRAVASLLAAGFAEAALHGDRVHVQAGQAGAGQAQAGQTQMGQADTEQADTEQGSAGQPTLNPAEAHQTEARQTEADQTEAHQTEAHQTEARQTEAEQVGAIGSAGDAGAAGAGQSAAAGAAGAAERARAVSEALSRAGLAPRSVVAVPLSMEDVFVHRVLSLEAQDRKQAGKPAGEQAVKPGDPSSDSSGDSSGDPSSDSSSDSSGDSPGDPPGGAPDKKQGAAA